MDQIGVLSHKVSSASSSSESTVTPWGNQFDRPMYASLPLPEPYRRAYTTAPIRLRRRPEGVDRDVVVEDTPEAWRREWEKAFKAVRGFQGEGGEEGLGEAG
jgi:hypothetical protein